MNHRYNRILTTIPACFFSLKITQANSNIYVIAKNLDKNTF